MLGDHSFCQLHVGNLVSQSYGQIGSQSVGGQERHVGRSEQQWVVFGFFDCGQELCIDLSPGLFKNHFSFNFGHFEIVLLPLYHFVEFYLFNLKVGLGLDDLLPLLCKFFLETHLFLLSCDEEIHFDLLHLLEVAFDTLWYFGLGDSNGQYFDAGCPVSQIFVQGLDELLVELIKDVDVDLLE